MRVRAPRLVYTATSLQTFPIDSQTLNVWGSMCHSASLTAALMEQREKHPQTMRTDTEPGCVPTKPYLQGQVGSGFWPASHTLLIPVLYLSHSEHGTGSR